MKPSRVVRAREQRQRQLAREADRIARMEKAIQHVRDGETVERAALLAGYSDAKAFSRACVQRTGKRPGEWRTP